MNVVLTIIYIISLRVRQYVQNLCGETIIREGNPGPERYVAAPNCILAACHATWKVSTICVCLFPLGRWAPISPMTWALVGWTQGICPVRFGQWPTPGGPGGPGPTLAIQLADRIQEARPTLCYLSTKMLVDSLPIVGYTGYKLWSSVMGIQCLNTKTQILAILGAIPPMYCVCNWPIPIWMGQIVGKGWEMDSSWLPSGISMDSRFSNIGTWTGKIWSWSRNWVLIQGTGLWFATSTRLFCWFLLLSLQPGKYWDYILGVPKAYVYILNINITINYNKNK